MTYIIEDLKAQVKAVIDHSNEMDSKIDGVIEGWSKSKSKLIEEFGGELIVESPSIMTFDMPDEDKIIKYREYMDDIGFMTANEEARAFLLDQGWTSFYENSVREKWSKYGHNIPKGMKISRALKFFLKDQEELEKWQNVYSKIIQDVKISGRICLSVHPLDFLSISETTHSWRSCHSLDGEYRAGNISYMMDEVTVVAYLKSEGEHTLPSFPEEVKWNSKKWRMLLYVNEDRDMVFSSKPYPFENNTLVNLSYKMLERALGKTWSSEYTTIDPDIAMSYICDTPGSLQFNDCLSSMSYNPRYKCEVDKEPKDCKIISVGAPVPCLDCGLDYVEFSADYSCVNCGDYETCEECGCHMYADEAYELDGQTVCPGCYDEDVVWCNGCGGIHSRENPEMYYDEEEGEWFCPECYEENQVSESLDEESIAAIFDVIE